MKALEKLYRALCAAPEPVTAVADPLEPWDIDEPQRRVFRLHHAVMSEAMKRPRVGTLHLTPEQTAIYSLKLPSGVTVEEFRERMQQQMRQFYPLPSQRSSVAALNSSVEALEKDWEKVVEDGEKVRDDFERAAANAR